MCFHGSSSNISSIYKYPALPLFKMKKLFQFLMESLETLAVLNKMKIVAVLYRIIRKFHLINYSLNMYPFK